LDVIFGPARHEKQLVGPCLGRRPSKKPRSARRALYGQPGRLPIYSHDSSSSGTTEVLALLISISFILNASVLQEIKETSLKPGLLLKEVTPLFTLHK
jgi:hypothetical protein